VETRDKLPGIYEEIENIKQRMSDEKERLIQSAKESMMLKLTLKNQIMMKWESPEN
jgi:molecular chaperone GrpE (heat shock protein)